MALRLRMGTVDPLAAVLCASGGEGLGPEVEGLSSRPLLLLLSLISLCGCEVTWFCGMLSGLSVMLSRKRSSKTSPL